VVPAGDGLVPPPLDGPVQREGEAGAGDQPGGGLPGETGQPGGLGDRQPDGGEAGRAGLAAADRDRRVTEGNQQVSVADIAVVHGVAGVVPGAGELDVAGERVADGGAPELGEGGQGGVAADAVPAPGLGLVPAEHVLARFERFLYRPAAPGDGDEIRHGGRPARRRPAQVERQLIRREISRRISRYCPLIPVAVIAQSL
jgi:hypothetical protein